MRALDITIKIDPALFTKNPETSDLGRRIVMKSIEMIEALGFEKFTFKKLGTAIGSNESSVYRYFENKHMLLVYLISWYWSWVEYRLVFATQNVASKKEKLRNAIRLLTKKIDADIAFSYINEVALHRIIVAESAKAYHTKKIDNENKKGYYKVYKRVVQRVSEFCVAMNPDFKYPNMLVSTVIEGSHKQRYFSEHLPSLTDTTCEEDAIVRFYVDLVFKTIA